MRSLLFALAAACASTQALASPRVKVEYSAAQDLSCSALPRVPGLRRPRYKVHTLFHELLHLFLFQHPVRNSVLLRKNAAESERVRDHLHLLALQKAILLKLDERDALNEVIAVDSALPGGHYKRAWEIVNATESEYLEYVAELSTK